MDSVDAYLSTFPAETQKRIQQIRLLIKSTVPNATETFAYMMPAYKLNGKAFVYFAAYERHIGFYSMGIGQQEFADELKGFKQGKGSIQFPLDKALPIDLIKRIIQLKAQHH